MKILFLGNGNNPLLVHLAARIKVQRPDISIDIVSEATITNRTNAAVFGKVYEIPTRTGLWNKPILKTLWMIRNFRSTLNTVDGKYDVIHMFFLHIGYSKSIDILQKLAPRLILSIFGSELYRSPELVLKRLQNLVNASQLVTAANESTLSDFKNRFGVSEDRTRICRFGLAPLDTIKKVAHLSREEHRKKAGLPVDAFIITCGYNASPGQQHEAIIDSLARVKSQLPANYLLVFPVAMGGNEERINMIEAKLKSVGFNHKFIRNFLPENDLAHFRCATDVMIQIQKTDQLSGAMQEHLFAGCAVITGSWLPYSVFDAAGVVYRKVNNPIEVGEKTAEVCRTYTDLKSRLHVNEGIIWNLSSWEKCADSWISLYK